MRTWIATLAFAVVLSIVTAAPASAQYSVRRTSDLVQLGDATNEIVVTIAPSAGNLTREMTVKGQNVLGTLGIPFLAPWANRLDEQAFYANGKRYAFDMDLGNVTGTIPIHGFMSRTDQWNV